MLIWTQNDMDCLSASFALKWNGFFWDLRFSSAPVKYYAVPELMLLFLFLYML